ncbi:tyrosine-protein kinase SRK2-like [Gigantopelta aegis]|uniref:tyrosine-protein kinase SRK2-like n=1 Tax=Gigantopelta aegis TaxID=1735272 RepID=UPI001B88779B|nr:tyrosine-protein kinase SRK2-like [Gigantopelta aegis]
MGQRHGKHKKTYRPPPPSVIEITQIPSQPTETESDPVVTSDVRISVQKRELPPLPIPETKPVLYRALFDFTAISNDDLSFKKGDRLEVEDSSRLESDWWIATNKRSGKHGYIPGNYVAKDNSPESQEWWLDVKRAEANTKLMLASIKVGTFLIRPSSNKSAYALSVRNEGSPLVAHYEIKPLDDGGWFISPRHTFPSITRLVEHYKANEDLCCKLTTPCHKVPPPVNIRELEIDRTKVKKLNRIGTGHYGEVFKAKIHNIHVVAVKTLKTGTMTSANFLEEAQKMHKLRYAKLVTLIGVCTLSEPIYIITEFMENGSLLEFMRDSDNKQYLKLPAIINIAGQISDGMDFLSSQNYVHRDLRAANILVGSDLNVKIADFGLAKVISEDAKQTVRGEMKFPVKWTAPEAAHKNEFSIKSDVWSFGVLMYEMITFGRVPYAGMRNAEVMQNVYNGYRMPKPTDSAIVCPDWYYETMLKCWNDNPEARPTFEHLYNTFVDECANEPITYNENNFS